MTSLRIISRSLRFYWRTQLGVAAGAAVATAVLVGALVVGDSVRYSLREMALARLGETRLAMATGERYFTAELAASFAAAAPDAAEDGEDGGPAVAAALDLGGIVSVPGGDRRANGVRVVGVDERFWSFAPNPPPLHGPLGPGEVVVNQRLADQLRVEAGDRVLLRIAKPSALPRDIPLGSEVEDSVRMNATVAAVAEDDQFGRFGLQVTQVPPFNLFLPLDRLQRVAEIDGRANTLLVRRLGDAEDDEHAADLQQANAIVHGSWTLADAQAELIEWEDLGVLELRSERVFLDPPLVEAAERAAPGARRILTYFVNELRARGDPEGEARTTPYSMVAAFDPPAGEGDALNPLPPGMADDEIVINEWLAEDLAVEAGDEVTLTYFVLAPGRRLEEESTTFRVRAVVPTEGPGGDRELMADFPGLADAESSLDWEPGIPIDLTRIRDKDERYWDDHRGTPKAFVTLDWATEHWGNQFGELTALRWDLAELSAEEVAAGIRERFDPASIGFAFRPVRAEALAASAQGTDFGGLFLGLSFFLMMAALLLTALLFVFGVEQRTPEVGTLLAVGFTPGQVRRLWLLEGGLLAVIGALAGMGLGVLYTRGVLWALTTMWRDAVAHTSLSYRAEWSTLAIGGAAGIAVALASMWWVLRRQGRQPARALLAARFGMDPGGGGGAAGGGGRRWALWCGAAAIGAAAAIAVAAVVAADGPSADVFFAAGSLLLIGGLCVSGAILRAAGGRGGAGDDERAAGHLTLSTLGWRNSGRRRGRSLATVTMLAAGCFLIVSINAFRHDPAGAALQRDSGTGGFALYAETTLPIHEDLNTPDGREAFLLDDEQMAGVGFVQMRLLEGDDASCLNLNRPRTPPLLGVDPEALASRDAFVFVRTLDGERVDHPWRLLAAADDRPDEPVPAIVDDSVATWILKKRLGETIAYTDERGRPFEVRIVGTTTNSILQGRLLVSERQLQRRFPSAGGYRVMLIDAPAERIEEVRAGLERSLADVGIQAMEATERLAMFLTVENTYLTIFGVLGGLGLVLGCIGLGLVVLRNVLERRSELALMRSVGFARRSLRWLVLSEHWVLLVLGVGVGVIAALVAVVPALLRPGTEVPYLMIALTLGAVALSGLVWTMLATLAALRGRLIEGLRSE